MSGECSRQGEGKSRLMEERKKVRRGKKGDGGEGGETCDIIVVASRVNNPATRFLRRPVSARGDFRRDKETTLQSSTPCPSVCPSVQTPAVISGLPVSSAFLLVYSRLRPLFFLGRARL